MAENVQKYSLVLKKQIVDLYQTGHWSCSQLKCKYGVSKETVMEWSNQYTDTNDLNKTVILEQYRMLEKQIKSLKKDQEVLKQVINIR